MGIRKNYIDGNYTVPEIESDKYDIKIDSYNMDNKLLKHYKNIYEASEDLSLYRYEIYNVVKGKSKSVKNYKFKISA